MDDVIFEEFKGTGNMELHLDRNLAEKRIFPAIDVYKSGTRREDLLLTAEEIDALYKLRRSFTNGNNQNISDNIIEEMKKTRDNKEFIEKINQIILNSGYKVIELSHILCYNKGVEFY